MKSSLRQFPSRLKAAIRAGAASAINGALADLVATNRREIFAADRFRELIARNPLLGPPVCHFSQNDEDGILLRILGRIGLERGRFLEVGVGDGLQNNTLVLLAMGWRGAWIGGVELAFKAQGRLSFTQAWVTRDNIVSLASNMLALSDVRVASIDLDGNDFYVLSALLQGGMLPEVIVVEYNAKYPPSVDFVMAYNPEHRWDGDDYFGASLCAWCRLLEPAGYRLVVCSITGVNAFFVHDRHAAQFQDVPQSVSDLYVEGRYLPLPNAGHRTSTKAVEQWIKEEGE